MTAYVVDYDNNSNRVAGILNYTFAPVTFPIRLARIDAFAGGSSSVVISNYTSPTISGGTTLTPLPLRGGAASPPATCSVKSGATISGTKFLINTLVVGQNGITQGPYGAVTTYQQGQGSFSAGYDYIIPVGSAMLLELDFPGTGVYYEMTAYFEEVRVNLSF